MSKKSINIGKFPGDGTGDTLRDAFSKTNDNFNELYHRLSKAEVVIASSASSATIKDMADIVVDGIDDDVEIQSAINNTANYPGGIIALGSFNLSTNLVPVSGTTIKGIKPILNFTANCPDLGWTQTGGTIFNGTPSTSFMQANTNQDPINDPISTVTIDSVGFQNFKTVFEIGGQNRLGLAMSEIKNIFVAGTFSDALKLTNFQHLKMEHIKMFNVASAGILKAWHDSCQPGNSYFEDFYAYIKFRTNPEYGLKLMADATGVGDVDGSLNLCTFNRLQINMFGGTPGLNPGNAQLKLQGDASSSKRVLGCSFHDLDVEGEADSAVDLQDTSKIRINFSTVPDRSKVNVATLKMRGALNTYIESYDTQVTVDMDGASDPSFISGMVGNPNVQNSERVPRGIYYSVTDGDFVKLQAGSNVFQGWRFGPSSVEQTGEDPSLIQNQGMPLTDLVIDGLNGTGLIDIRRMGVWYINNTQAIIKTLPVPAKGLSCTIIKTSDNPFEIVVDVVDGGNIAGFLSNSEINSYGDSITFKSSVNGWFIASKNISL